LAKLGQDADLLIAESYFYSKPIKWHLNYPEFRTHKDDFGAKRIILTHMSRDMLAHVHDGTRGMCRRRSGGGRLRRGLMPGPPEGRELPWASAVVHAKDHARLLNP
jgi:hypothetical protein